MSNVSGILTGGEGRFLNQGFVYYSVAGANQGTLGVIGTTTVNGDKISAIGPGIDCSALVYQSES